MSRPQLLSQTMRGYCLDWAARNIGGEDIGEQQAYQRPAAEN